jgi:hypothetical protein
LVIFPVKKGETRQGKAQDHWAGHPTSSTFRSPLPAFRINVLHLIGKCCIQIFSYHSFNIHHSPFTTNMSDSLMFNNDAYVVLETDQPEQLLTPAEMFEKLQEIVSKFADDLPIDVQRITGVDERVKYLLDTSCKLDLAPGEYLQWYVVRLEK